MVHEYTFEYTCVRGDGSQRHYTLRSSITDEQLEEMIQKSNAGDENALKKAAFCIERCKLEAVYETWLLSVADRNSDAQFALERLKRSRSLSAKIGKFFNTKTGEIVGIIGLFAVLAGIVFLAFHLGGMMIGIPVGIVIGALCVYLIFSVLREKWKK